MGFAVFHIEKVTTGASSLGAHIDRSPGHEYTYKNADPARLQENNHLTCGSFNKMKLGEAIDLRIKTAYTGKKAIRKDAVNYNNTIKSIILFVGIMSKTYYHTNFFISFGNIT